MYGSVPMTSSGAVGPLGSAPLAGNGPDPGRGAEAREAEVEQLGAALRQHDVGRLQVAMDDTLRVRSDERLGDFPCRAQGLREWHQPLAQSRRECLAFEILHDQEIDPLMVAHLVQRTDARMRESCDGAGFVREARPGSRFGCGVKREHLDRNVAIESRVAGFVDLAHPPGADKTLDLEDSEPRSTGQHV